MAVTDTRRETNILAEIVRWAEALPTWQQDALRRIAENSEVTDDDVNELVRFCKWNNDIADGAEPEILPITAEHVPRGSHSTQVVTLRSLGGVEHVNALDSQQQLDFADSGLTVIFGYNGSGKSGYGRILRRACRSRSNGPAILPNVLAESLAGPASAEITYALNGVEQPPEQWIDSQRSVEPLGSVSFFDAQCAVAHVREQNDIAFTPYGLDVLPKLGAACKQVQRRLDEERKRLESVRPKFFQSSIANGDTAVGTLLKSLRHNTDLAEIVALAALNEANQTRLGELPGLLANDPQRAVQDLRNRARRIENLKTTLETAGSVLSTEALNRIKALATDHIGKSQAAEVAAKRNFANDPLPGIGQAAWQSLWESARRYSSVAYPDREYPVVDANEARCVLCQQILDGDAIDRLRRFEAFVADDTAKQAATAKVVLDNSLAGLDTLGLRDKGVRERLADLKVVNPATCKKVRQFIAACLRRLRTVHKGVASGDWTSSYDGAIADVDGDLRTIVEMLQSQADDCEKSTDVAGRKQLQAELAELKAREWLGTVLEDVKDHVTRLADIAKFDRCIEETKTNKITAKSKALAKQHVTDQLRDAFATETLKMHQGVRRLNVELSEAAGEYGASCYRIQLVGARQAELESIVSEGEHRCIALAGFLAELATESCRSGIVFDDPVTSLDHHWREAFSRRLVEEGATRQVIVFTHDIVFLHDLMSGAEREVVPISLSCVRAEHRSCGVVSDGLPWIGQKTLQRIDELEKLARLARDAYDNHRDDEYDRDIGHIYDRLRSTVERAVEECFFRGVVLRHRDYINLKELQLVAVLTAQDCEQLQKLFQRCCDITEAHDRASLRSFGIPTPTDALNDLAELRKIIDDVKARQKAVA